MLATPTYDYIKSPQGIYEESFRIIREEANSVVR